MLLERDDIDNYVTSSLGPDLPAIDEEDDNLQEINGQIDYTNAGEYVLNVREDNQNKGTYKDITISGHTILNQNGSLLTRKRHQIKGSRKQSFFYRKFVQHQLDHQFLLSILKQCFFRQSFGRQLMIISH